MSPVKAGFAAAGTLVGVVLIIVLVAVGLSLFLGEILTVLGILVGAFMIYKAWEELQKLFMGKP